MMKLLLPLVLYPIGFGLIWAFGSWQSAIGVFVVLWASNVERGRNA